MDQQPQASSGYRPRAPRVKLPEYAARDVDQAAPVAPAPYVTVALFSAITGFTEKAIRRKKETGVWLENVHWRLAPDGTVLMSMEGYRAWVEQPRRA